MITTRSKPVCRLVVVQAAIGLVLLALIGSACAGPVAPPTAAATSLPPSVAVIPSPTPLPPPTTTARPPTLTPLPPTLTPAPSASPTPPLNLPLEDTFDKLKNGWNVGAYAGYQAQISGGSLAVTVTQANQAALVISGLAAADVDMSFDAQIDVAPVPAAGAGYGADYGAVCRTSQAGYYTFEVGDGGWMTINRSLAGVTTTLAHKASGAILAAPATNRLRVICSGKLLTMIVNDKVLAVLYDDKLPDGGSGFSVSISELETGPATAHFDNLRIVVPEPGGVTHSVNVSDGVLVYQQQVETGVEIHTARLDGSNQHTLAADQYIWYTAPAWSPDGRQIAYTDGWPGGNIFVMQADGSGKRQITKLSDNNEAEFPAWSPDGQQIAFVWLVVGSNTYPAQTSLYVMHADGSGLRRLTHTGDATMPAWSPDGKTIAYVAGVKNGAEIHQINPDGTHDVRLTKNPAADDINFLGGIALAPDGQHLAFVSNRNGWPHIYVLDIASGAQTALTDSPMGSDLSPAWSPDGTRIAFVSDRLGTPFNSPSLMEAASDQIFVMNTDGSGQTQITSGDGVYDRPMWQP